MHVVFHGGDGQPQVFGGGLGGVDMLRFRVLQGVVDVEYDHGAGTEDGLQVEEQGG